MSRYTLALFAIAVVCLIAACGSREKRDAHQIGLNRVDRTPADWIVGMPDDYPNIAEKCDIYGNRIFAATHNGGHTTLFWVKYNDPTCKSYRPTRLGY